MTTGQTSATQLWRVECVSSRLVPPPGKSSGRLTAVITEACHGDPRCWRADDSRAPPLPSSVCVPVKLFFWAVIIITLHLFFYCFYSYAVVIFEQPLAQELTQELLELYLILSYQK